MNEFELIKLMKQAMNEVLDERLTPIEKDIAEIKQELVKLNKKQDHQLFRIAKLEQEIDINNPV